MAVTDVARATGGEGIAVTDVARATGGEERDGSDRRR